MGKRYIVEVKEDSGSGCGWLIFLALVILFIMANSK